MKVIDYLAEELKKQEATKTRKDGKHERVSKLTTELRAKAAGAGR